MKTMNLKNMIEAWEGSTDRKGEIYNAFYMMAFTGFISKKMFSDFDRYVEQKAQKALI